MKAAVAITGILWLGASGCVTRTIRIESEPTGATVILDGKPAGTTPLTVPFEWYGDREIIVEKKGFLSHSALHSVAPPWWQIFPIDLISGVLLPIPLHDEHLFEIRLEPFEHGPDDFETTKKHAEWLKKKADN